MTYPAITATGAQVPNSNSGSALYNPRVLQGKQIELRARSEPIFLECLESTQQSGCVHTRKGRTSVLHHLVSLPLNKEGRLTRSDLGTFCSYIAGPEVQDQNFHILNYIQRGAQNEGLGYNHLNPPAKPDHCHLYYTPP